jgi:hypothetical protein
MFDSNNKLNISSIVKLFLTWKVLLFVVTLLSIPILSLQFNFLGGGLSNYLSKPYLWTWANFDGEHYLAIAKEGYRPLTYFFFPIYPILIRIVSSTFRLSHIFSALTISNISFLIGLIGLAKLIKLDYGQKVTKLTILLYLFFPTSFYFTATYTEALFFALVIWTFYFARQKKWIIATVLASFLTATRIVGVAIIPAFFIEYYQAQKNKKLLSIQSIKSAALSLIPLSGITIYMYFLYQKTGDPLRFLNTISIFGAQRSSNLIMLPQVFYRYFVKILPNLNYSYFPVIFSTYLETISAIVFLVLITISFFKTRLSYAIFATLTYLIPTFSGSFSSLPRYILVVFPAFILTADWLKNKPKKYIIITFLCFIILQIIALSLFSRGYWLS